MSLLLFEHIHGESRDRGQAMVDLMRPTGKRPRTGGQASCRTICPDAGVPVPRPDAEVVDWLTHTGDILDLLAARAGERGSGYACARSWNHSLPLNHNSSLRRAQLSREAAASPIDAAHRKAKLPAAVVDASAQANDVDQNFAWFGIVGCRVVLGLDLSSRGHQVG